MLAHVWELLIYWLVLFVACYTAVEVAQDQLYDGVTPRVGLKVGLGSLILAALLTWIHPSFESMFTTGFIWTLLQAIVWFVVFTLVFQFHPPHALGLALAMMLIIPGLATLAVESVLKPRPRVANVAPASSGLPVRRPIGTPPPAAKKDAPAARK